MKNRADQSGMTLVEIMIALLIGVFLLGGILQIFVSGKQTNRMQENLSRLQENGRFAIGFLSRDIRMAGFWGCMIPTSTEIDGTDGASGAPDSMTLRGAFERTDVWNCGTPVVPAPTISCPKLADPANIYTDTTSIITYSIVNNALRRTTNCITTANADVVEGIENMQILYGVDTDPPTPQNKYGTPNYYVSANSLSAADWPKVVSIRITLTARTLEGNLIPTGDGRIRRNFTSTIVVRNRLE